MARKRTTPVPPGGKAPRADGRKKVQMWLPAGLVRQLKHEATERGVDLGELCAPPLRTLVGNRWLPHRRDGGEPADPPAVRLASPPEAADPPEGESGETAA